MTNLPDAHPDDSAIDLTDVPELDEAWFRSATLRQPTDLPKRPMRIDADIVEFFRETTANDQDAINAVLRSFVTRAKERAGS
jgi:uncharacterized protein (DUF4415 family)